LWRTTEVILRRLNYQVEVATDGLQAVEAFSRQSYDLILMDCQMPVMDGFEATRRIRQLEGDTHHTPIIAVTSGAIYTAKEPCLNAGMDDFVSKPVSAELLRKVLKLWLPN
jgi:CheY-like chemotaxis protein